MSEPVLQGKVALITGGAAGIGLAIARQFIDAGARVALFDHSAGVLQVAEALGPEVALGVVVDVSKKARVGQSVQQVIMHFGQLDIVVNSAGVALLSPAESLSESDWDRTLDVNLKGTFLVAQAAGNRFLAQGHGNIINIASQASVVGLPAHAAYCASKAAVIGLTQVLALEWGPHNININAISPGVVLTGLGKQAWESGQLRQQVPPRRFAGPEHIAETALFLASPGAAMINGTNLVVDGGYTLR